MFVPADALVPTTFTQAGVTLYRVELEVTVPLVNSKGTTGLGCKSVSAVGGAQQIRVGPVCMW